MGFEHLSAGTERQPKCGLRDLWTEALRLQWKIYRISIAGWFLLVYPLTESRACGEEDVCVCI